MDSGHWIEDVKLGEYIDLVSGFAFKSSDFSDNPNDIPLVKGSNLQQEYIDWVGAARWPRDQYNNFEKFQLQPDDVVLAMDRPWVEAGLKYCWIKKNDPKSLLVQRVCRLRGKEGLLTTYLRYVIGSAQFTEYIKLIVTGVNVPHISGQQIKDYKFHLPPIAHQEKIVSILEKYDSLIENNTRRIAILEEMAQAIYREWFVEFKYPGNDADFSLVNGELPAGWSFKKVLDFGKVITGKTPSKKNADNYGEDVPFIKTPDMHKGMFVCDVSERLSFKGAATQKGKLLPENSICVSCIGTAGIVAITPFEAQTNQQINSLLLADERYREYLYFALVGLKQTIENYGSTGATMTNLSKGKFESLEVLSPTKSLVDEFNDLVSPMFDSILDLTRLNINLVKQRDLLLPKLISGQIELS